MAHVMMRCPTRGEEFDTGLKIPRKTGLNNIGLNTVLCPHCNYHHHVRQPYFAGDKPADWFPPADGLETAPAFAMEVGIIIAGAVFMESYILQIFSKVSGMSSSHGVVVFGAFPSTSSKIGVLDILCHLEQSVETKKDLKKIIEKFRKCSTIRDFYAHSKYSYSGGEIISIIPFFGDSRKRAEGMTKSLDEIRADAIFMQRTKYMIRDFINNDVRPTR